jgi:hypothetical protein
MRHIAHILQAPSTHYRSNKRPIPFPHRMLLPGTHQPCPPQERPGSRKAAHMRNDEGMGDETHRTFTPGSQHALYRSNKRPIPFPHRMLLPGSHQACPPQEWTGSRKAAHMRIDEGMGDETHRTYSPGSQHALSVQQAPDTVTTPYVTAGYSSTLPSSRKAGVSQSSPHEK